MVDQLEVYQRVQERDSMKTVQEVEANQRQGQQKKRTVKERLAEGGHWEDHAQRIYPLILYRESKLH